ncbi:MAG: hypothetical protein ACSHXL_02805 [Bacteroidota bacterium]
MEFLVVSIIRTSDLGALNLEEVFAAAQEFPSLHIDYEKRELVITRAGGLESRLIWNAELQELISHEAESDVITVMIQLADKLEARVRDEFLRTYITPTELYEHSDDIERIQSINKQFNRQAKSLRWRNLLARFVAPLGVVLMIFLLNYLGLWPQSEVFSDYTEEEGKSVIANAHLGEKAEVLFVPLDDFSTLFLGRLAIETNRMTGLRVRVATPRVLPEITQYEGKNQFDAMKMIASQAQDIGFLRRRYGNGTLIYFTTRDINQGNSQTRFVFSHQDYRNRICMISSSRLVSGVGMKYASESIVQERILKFVLRAVAEQNLGLERSKDQNTIMASPIGGILDVDDLKYTPFEQPLSLSVELNEEGKKEPMHPVGVAMCIIGGLFSIMGASRNWNLFFAFFPASIIESISSRGVARLFYAILGIFIIAGGILGAMNMI